MNSGSEGFFLPRALPGCGFGFGFGFGFGSARDVLAPLPMLCTAQSSYRVRDTRFLLVPGERMNRTGVPGASTML